MRRLWAAGAAFVMCAALGVPVVAQGDFVTGTWDCGGYPLCSIEMSDPRVSGDVWFDMDVDLGPVAWGPTTIGGPDGDWNGPFVTYWNDDVQGYVTLFTVEGTGAYEGWTFVATWMGKDNELTAEVTGRVYQGAAPRMEWPGIATYPGTREPSPSPTSE